MRLNGNITTLVFQGNEGSCAKRSRGFGFVTFLPWLKLMLPWLQDLIQLMGEWLDFKKF